jgi:hypothetical protein
VIHEALNAYAGAIARVFPNRHQTVGASEIGQCIRKTFWVKHEGDPARSAPRDADYVDKWGARTRGSTYEEYFWLPALRAKYGADLLFAGAEQRTLTSGRLSATPDGLLRNQPRDALAALGVPDIGESRCFVVEAKTIDPRAALERAKDENVFQAQIQLGLLRELTEYRPEYALVSYADASFWDEIKEFIVQFDETVFINAKARAAKTMTAASAAELLPEGWVSGGKECGFCPFTKACGRSRTAVPTRQTTDPDPQFVAEFVDLAREIKTREGEAETAGTKLREAQLALKERMRTRGVSRIKTETVSITWSSVKGRETFDNTAIREVATAAGIDLAKYQTIGESSDRLTIQVTGSPVI